MLPHLVAMRGELGPLFGSQDSKHLRHHSRVRNLHFYLNFRAGICSGAHSCFIEFTAQRIALAFDQGAHLLAQRLITLLETLRNLLNLRSLVVGQI